MPESFQLIRRTRAFAGMEAIASRKRIREGTNSGKLRRGDPLSAGKGTTTCSDRDRTRPDGVGQRLGAGRGGNIRVCPCPGRRRASRRRDLLAAGIPSRIPSNPVPLGRAPSDSSPAIAPVPRAGSRPPGDPGLMGRCGTASVWRCAPAEPPGHPDRMPSPKDGNEESPSR